ncbi:MAG: Ig-like domain-containing protein, partial [Lachnospiraceae bacterium]|nr:Ig-like domain-containing protein [Lachnospiraceae bacterium]
DSTIIFDKEGGSYEDDEYDLKASGNNQYYTLKSNPTKEGYAFNNWMIAGSGVTLTEGNYIAYETAEDSKTYIRVYDNSSRTNKLYECESEFGINLIATYQFTAFPSAKIELSMDGGNVAGVNSLSYELNTFDLSDSATQSDRIEYTAMTLPTPTKDGYIFAGWEIGDKVYDAGTEIKYEISITNENGKVTIGTDAQSAITSDTTYTLTAQWITLPMTEVTASGVTKVYDGNPSDVITVSGIPAGAAVTYGTVEGIYDLSACPTYTDAGDHTVYYKVSAYEYTDYTGSAVIKIHPKPVSITWSTEDEFTYDGSEHSVTATVNNGVGDDSFTISYESDGNNVHAATNAGNYTAVVNDVGNSNYTVVDGENISKEWKISYPDIDAGVTVSGDKQKPSSRWYIGDVTIKPDTGYQIQKEGDSQWQDELVITDEGRTSVTYQLKDSNGYITAPETKEICIDRIAPMGEISVGSDNSNKWNTFLNTITFGRFFKETQSVKISGVDEVGGSGVNQVYYYVSETALTQEQVYALEDSDWKVIPNNGTFSIDPDKKLILYAKISDEAGYTIWISTDGLVLDATAPAITGVTDGKAYCDGKTITVKDTNLDTVTVNGTGVTLENDTYLLSTTQDSGKNFAIVATDKAGNSTMVNVTIYKDHNWPVAWTVTKQATATEEGKEEQECANCGQKKYRTIPATGSQEADPTNGHLTKDAEVAPDAPVMMATLNNAKSEIISAAAIFTDTEKTAITTGGQNARIWLEISKTDENQIMPTDKANIMNAAEQIMGENPDITYFDADLFKKVGNDSKIKISEPGIYIEVTIQIPDELLNHNRVMIREYQIIRLHEGAVTVIRNGIFNEDTKEFTFKTDKFSTYAIAYSDTPRPGSTSGGDGGSGGSTIISVPVTNITVTPEKATLTKKGETLSLTAKVVPTNATNQKVTWASSDSKVATVDENGIVTAVGDGTVTISATTANGKSASSMITVKITPEEPDVGDIQMDTTYRKLRLRVPTSTKTTNVLKWTKFSGADGYVIYGNKCNTKSKTYKMVQQVVIKDGSTTTWVDKKLASGTYYKYYIKAYKLVNGKKVWLAKSKVVHSTTTGGKYGNAKSVKVNKTAVSLAAGKTFTIKAEQIVKDLPIKKHTEIKYESSNSKVAAVNSKGVIRAKKKGICYIYVYAQNGMCKRVKVTVK